MTTGAERTFSSTAPILLVLSGPSGVGKDALLARLRQRGHTFAGVVTVTTRSPRPGERDGVEYRFASLTEFHQMVEGEELLEWARVYGHCYGVPREPVNQALASGQDVILRTDVQGAATIRRKMPQALLVFLAPRSIGELERRLRQRGTDAPEEIAQRLHEAAREMADVSLFDYVIVNEEGGLETAVEALEAVLTSQRSRIPPHPPRV